MADETTKVETAEERDLRIKIETKQMYLDIEAHLRKTKSDLIASKSLKGQAVGIGFSDKSISFVSTTDGFAVSAIIDAINLQLDAEIALAKNQADAIEI